MVTSLPENLRNYLYEDEHIYANFKQLMKVYELSGLGACGRSAAIDSYNSFLQNGVYFRDMCVDLHNQNLIAGAAIRRPLLIVGLSRSGTTALHKILNCDSRLYCQNLKQMWSSIDSTRPTTNVAAMLHNFGMLIRLVHIHDINLKAPEAIFPLFFNFGFDSGTRCGSLCTDQITNWMESLDTSVYVSFYTKAKQYLMYLQQTYSPSSTHIVVNHHLQMTRLEAIAKVFPDAVFIHTVRDPCNVVGSSCSLFSTCYLNAIRPKPTLSKHGNFILADMANKANEYVRFRRSNTEKFTFVDVQYNELVTDPLSVMKQIYKAAGLDVTPDLEEKVQAHLKRSKQHKYGKHQYSLETYGLTAELVNEAFKPYKDFYNI